MADIRVPGELSGKEYNIRIAGDSPTADERQRIDAFVRQSETQFAGEYEAQFGENLLPSTGFGAQVGEMFRGIPRGVGSLLQSSATGLEAHWARVWGQHYRSLLWLPWAPLVSGLV